MTNDILIEYLKSCKTVLGTSLEDQDSKMLSFLYFAPIEERMSIHVVEKSLNYGSWQPLHTSLIQKNQNDILNFKPQFDAALKKHNISSIASKPYIHSELQKIENSKGIFNALLTLREWAFFPKKSKGYSFQQRSARSYLQIVMAQLHCMRANNEIDQFLSWCGKATQKILPWSKFKEKQLLSPPTSALPIYRDEAVSYLRYFLDYSCNSAESLVKQDFAEMVVFLSLCFAGARQHSNYFDPADILKVTKDDIKDLTLASEKLIRKSERDTRVQSKSLHKSLQLRLSEGFLSKDKLWSSACSLETQKEHSLCKMVRIKDKSVLVGQRIAQAVERMEKFDITYKDLENRLREAYKAIGFSQSSGGISPRCFLNEPHYWEGVDVRYNEQLIE